MNGRMPAVEMLVAHWPVAGEPDILPNLRLPGGIAPKVVRSELDYNRGRGRNTAAAASAGDAIFFLDADMLVVPAVLERGLHYLEPGPSGANGQVFFPLYRRYTSATHERSIVEHGTGNCFLSRTQWEQFKWPEIEKWGQEDTLFWRHWKAAGLAVREPVAGFYHQWHPLAPDHRSAKPVLRRARP